jgi:hypothetical protein
MKSPYCASPALLAIGGFDRAGVFEDEIRRCKTPLARSFLAIDELSRAVAAPAYLLGRDWLGRFRLELSSRRAPPAAWIEKALPSRPAHSPTCFEFRPDGNGRPLNLLCLTVKGGRALIVLPRMRKWDTSEMARAGRMAHALAGASLRPAKP